MGLKIYERYGRRTGFDIIKDLFCKNRNREIIPSKPSTENILTQVDNYIKTIHDDIIRDLLSVKYTNLCDSLDALMNDLEVASRFDGDNNEAKVLVIKLNKLNRDLRVPNK